MTTLTMICLEDLVQVAEPQHAQPAKTHEWVQENGLTPSQSLARDRVWLQGFGPSATCVPARSGLWGKVFGSADL